MDKPTLIEGGRFYDDRGSVSFVNDFDFQGVKRFYQVYNFQANFVRAWHGHKCEGKYITVTKGAAIIAAAPIGLLDGPDNEFTRVILTEHKPSVLWVPPGYVNGSKSLVADTIITYYSTATLDESKVDDFRHPATKADWVWRVEER